MSDNLKMSDEEIEELDARKGPAKCFGTGKRGSLGRCNLPCKVPSTLRPTPLSQCLTSLQKEMACKAPPDTGLGQNMRDDRGPDNFPPQGGTLSKTCGVKAQFMGEIVIKKDIPPRPPQCQGKSLCQLNMPDFGKPPPFEEPVKTKSHCPNVIKHHTAPKCQVPLFPIQPEITESCRRVLRSRGPDSSRHHVLCPCMCPLTDEVCVTDYDDTGEEGQWDDAEPCDPICPYGKYPRPVYCYRYVNPYSPEWRPPCAIYGPPDVGSLPERQEYPPRCPGAWEGPPYQEDILTSPTWARHLDAMQEPPVCRVPCNPPAFDPETEEQRLNTPRYDYAATGNPCV